MLETVALEVVARKKGYPTPDVTAFITRCAVPLGEPTVVKVLSTDRINPWSIPQAWGKSHYGERCTSVVIPEKRV